MWPAFDAEVGDIRAALDRVPPDVPMMERRPAGHRLGLPSLRAGDVDEVRTRRRLISTVPAVRESAGSHYIAWEQAISEFAAARLGQTARSLYPLAAGRATLAACRAAYDRWSARATPISWSTWTRC